MFFIHNYDTLMLSVQALDPYAFDTLTNYPRYFNLLELFALRKHSIMRYGYQRFNYSPYYNLLIMRDLSVLLKSKSLQKQILVILQDLIYSRKNNKSCSKSTQQYIRRFTYQYRKLYSPYLSGRKQYSSDQSVNTLSFVNLFLLHRISNTNGTYIAFLHCTINNTVT
uniref:Uncharacterized protein n=1 Tax=Yamadaella caenomyce TaxID=259029 RepID=A0A1G4NZ18_9FLOR|nr:Hypothetical protein ORF_6 [Yamadaella caenomyce]SCW23895.1 Hypothetical protein ORF_6 [Yamadaella caenomyce]